MKMTEKNIIIIRYMGIIPLASIMYGVAVASFLDPNNVVPGGITGVAIILNRLTGIETGTMAFALNIPIIIMGLKRIGFAFTISTIYTIFLTSCSINYFGKMNSLTNDVITASLGGGVLLAISVAVIYKAGATTGGTDILVKIIRHKRTRLSTGNVFLIIDLAIVLMSVLVFRRADSAIYAGLTVILCSVVVDIIVSETKENIRNKRKYSKENIRNKR